MNSNHASNNLFCLPPHHGRRLDHLSWYPRTRIVSITVHMHEPVKNSWTLIEKQIVTLLMICSDCRPWTGHYCTICTFDLSYVEKKHEASELQLDKIYLHVCFLSLVLEYNIEWVIFWCFKLNYPIQIITFHLNQIIYCRIQFDKLKFPANLRSDLIVIYVTTETSTIFIPSVLSPI